MNKQPRLIYVTIITPKPSPENPEGQPIYGISAGIRMFGRELSIWWWKEF